MTTQVHPLAVEVERPNPRRDRRFTPQLSERLPVAIEPVDSPPPVPYSRFYGVGRDAAHAWPHRWLYQGLAIADKLSIAGWPFGVKRVPGALVTQHVPQGQNPLVTRTNIVNSRQMTRGQQSVVVAHGTYHPKYAKIL